MAAGETLSAGLIGAGWIAERHVAVIDDAPDVRLAAVCDADPERAAAVADPRRARSYVRWEEMLEREALDALWVCTPPLAHRGPAVEALRRGIHVYLEKPLARDVPWLYRDGRPAAASASLLEAARRLELPREPGAAYLAGEARTVQQLRRHFVAERGWPRQSVRTKPFWAPGKRGLD